MQEAQQSSEDFDPSKKWSVGAFFLTFIWGTFNNVWISFLIFIPFVGLITQFYLLIKGRKLAWEKGKWKSPEHFLAVQKKWDIAGTVIFVLLIGTVIVSSIFLIPSLKNIQVKAKASMAKVVLISAKSALEMDKIDTNSYSQASLDGLKPDSIFTIQTIDTNPELAEICPDCRITNDSYKIAVVGNLDDDPDMYVMVIESGSEDYVTLAED